MFSPDFYPTPENVILRMTEGYDLKGKVILEPSAGKGNIVDFLHTCGASVIACENNKDLKKILATKCNVIEEDFLKLTADKISHIDFIIMNPPFSDGINHILHAYEIAPAGCQIISLINSDNLKNLYTEARKRLSSIIEQNGNHVSLADCFKNSERGTDVDVSLITIRKAGESYSSEFEGFFMEEEIEEQENGIMSYNVVRDLVNRYVGAIKIFDQQLETAVQMNQLTGSFFSSGVGMSISRDNQPLRRNEFKKELQKSGWNYIFDKMNMQKYATRGLRDDINKFVEQQTEVPFTMRNIYRMIEIVIGTTEQRMDKAMLEVFDKLTTHYKENRWNVEGWATNSHYLVNRRFIFPHGAELEWGGAHVSFKWWQNSGETLGDVEKALCFLTGINWDEINKDKEYEDGKIVERNPSDLGFKEALPSKMVPGQWYETKFFKVRAYKKGTVHCEFKEEEIWGKFNQRIAKLKGYPLFEHTKAEEKKSVKEKVKTKAKILFTINLKNKAA